jgi:sporulation protein YlmC with PRC-barrel domain
MEMQFKQNANVYTLDGKNVGRIDRVVLDPKTNEITHLVVRKGFLLTEDKVVPVDLIGAATEKGVTLRGEVSELEALPLFEETQYVRVTGDPPPQAPDDAAGNSVNPFYWYPALGGVLPITLSDPPPPPYVVKPGQNIPEGTVAVKEGAEVIAADGKHVGTLEQILTDPHRDQATDLVIAQGLLVKERRRVPIQWVSEVKEGEIHLAVGSRTLEELGFIP